MTYHRHHGKRWTLAADATLRALLRQRTPLLVMALRLGRSKRAVAARVRGFV